MAQEQRDQWEPSGGGYGIRGEYMEQWTVFWIKARFLNAAAQFKELGLSLTY